MSDAAIVAVSTTVNVVFVALITSFFAYLIKKLEKKVEAVNTATDGIAVQVEQAKVAAKETSTKQDGMIKQQDEIHIATNSKLSAVEAELKVSHQTVIDELMEYKAEVKQLRASILEMAKQSVPQGSTALGTFRPVNTTLAPTPVVVVPSDDPLPVTVVPPEDSRS